MTEIAYPFVPKSNAKLRPGQFFAIALSDGRFGCGRVLGIDRAASYGSRTNVIVGVLDWVADRPPTSEDIAGAAVFTSAQVPCKAIAEAGGTVVGQRALDADGLVESIRVDIYAGASWPGRVAEARFVLPPRPPQPERRQVSSPLTDEMLTPMSVAGGVMQFSSMLTDRDLRRLAEWLEEHPGVELRAYGSSDGSITDLEFLRYFPYLEAFSADALHNSLTSLDGLRFLPESLRSLAIGPTRRMLDLAILEQFEHLERLHLEGQSHGIQVLGRLQGLQELSLRSITLPDLSILLPLEQLLAFELKLGGTHDLRLLPRIGRLEYIELWMVKGLVDLTPLAKVRTLRYLFLESLRRVERLPHLEELDQLTRVHLQNMKGLTDLSPLANAPALTDLVLWDMGHLNPEDLSCLVGHPTLRTISPYLGSQRKIDAARQTLRLPDATGGKLPWRKLER